MWCNAIDLAAGSYWIAEVLERSRDRPITVYIVPGTKEERIALIQSLHMRKVRGLYADLRDFNLARKVLRMVQELGGLEELNLVTNFLPGCARIREASWSRRRPAEGFPLNLRRLYLIGPSIPLPSYRVVNLSCLYITKLWGQKTAKQWLKAIRYLPGLQDLALIDCIKKDDITYLPPLHDDDPLAPFPSHPVPLPHLRELQLKGDHSACGSFFRELVIPRSCTLRIDTYDASIGPTLDAIVAFLQSNGQPSTSPAYLANNLSLYIKAFVPHTQLQVYQNEIVEQDIRLRYLQHYNQRMNIAVSVAQRLLDAMYNRFQTHGGFTTVTVCISNALSTCPQSRTQLATFFCSLVLGKVRDLRVQGTVSASELFRLLSMTEEGRLRGGNVEVSDNQDISTRNTVPPELQRISLLQVQLNESGGSRETSDCLVAFVNKCWWIKVVRLVSCTYPQSTVDQLSALGVQVTLG